MTGPAASLKWQEELKLNDTLLQALLPVADGATGEFSPKGSSSFFNTKMLDPTSKVRGATNLIQEKVFCAHENVEKMQKYASEANKVVGEKLLTVIKDWAKAKTAFYEMDAKIAAEKDKVRKILEVRITDLTKDKTALGTACSKHEARIAALERTERELDTANLGLKKFTKEIAEKQVEINEFETTVMELQTEVAAKKKLETFQTSKIGELQTNIKALETGAEQLKAEIAQKVAAIAQAKVEHTDVSEERDHFQVKYFQRTPHNHYFSSK